ILLVLADAPVSYRKVEPGILRLERVDITKHNHDIAVIVGAFDIPDDVVVLNLEESEVVVLLQGRMRLAYAVQCADVIRDIARSIPIPHLVLVLLGVEVLLLARNGCGFAKLESTVNAIDTRESRSEH